jgi:hypothetical protein
LKLAEQGQYTIERKNNVLFVDARGPFNEEITLRYFEDVKQVCRDFSGEIWGSLVTYYGNSIFTPEAEAGLIEITKYREDRGMVAIASVIMQSNSADLQQMQLARIYQATNITAHVFSNIDSATQWISEFINQEIINEQSTSSLSRKA